MSQQPCSRAVRYTVQRVVTSRMRKRARHPAGVRCPGVGLLADSLNSRVWRLLEVCA